MCVMSSGPGDVRKTFAVRMEGEDMRGENSKGEEDHKEDGGRTGTFKEF